MRIGESPGTKAKRSFGPQAGQVQQAAGISQLVVHHDAAISLHERPASEIRSDEAVALPGDDDGS